MCVCVFFLNVCFPRKDFPELFFVVFRFISIRKITFLGALVFLGFAIASIFIDPNEDGIDGIPDIQVYFLLLFQVYLFSSVECSDDTVVSMQGYDNTTTTSVSQLSLRKLLKDSTEKIRDD